MIIIQDKIVSEEIVEEQFLCNLTACKGACCWEGDAGAPLEDSELSALEDIYEEVRPFLSPAGQQAIEEQGLYILDKEDNQWRTPLVNNGPCAYMTLDKTGKASCGIEQAQQAGHINFRKPISCHLYPIRITYHRRTGLDVLNYDRWDICAAACAKGKEEQLPVYRFLKEALIRKYREDFYEELDQFARYHDNEKK